MNSTKSFDAEVTKYGPVMLSSPQRSSSVPHNLGREKGREHGHVTD